MSREIEKGIYVIDTETTGLDGYPFDLIVELAIYRINCDLTVEHVYDTLINYPSEYKDQIDNCYWSVNMSNIKHIDLKDSPYFEEVWDNMKFHLNTEKVISWNMSYDFSKFLDRLNKEYSKIEWIKLPCPMVVATNILKIENYYGYKWPRLDEASTHYNINLDPEGYGFHRADYDCHVTALVVAEMIKRGDYKP